MLFRQPDTPADRIVPTLYEDARLLAVVKPAGVDTGGLPGRRPSGLIELIQSVRDSGEALHPVNRLARYESGILLLGKDAGTDRYLRAAFKSNRIALEFIAVVLGRMPRKEVMIDVSRGSSRGRDRRAKPSGKRGRRTDRDPRSASTTQGRTSLTLIRTGERRSLIRCRTMVANTHILRAQLRSQHLRLVGDMLGERAPRRTDNEDTCLHLAKISLSHPDMEKRIVIRSRPPDAFTAALSGQRSIERFLHAALARRLKCLTESSTDSYRLISGSVEGVRGIVAERYGEVVVLQVHEDGAVSPQGMLSVARFYRDMLRIRTVYIKRFMRSRRRIDEDSMKELHAPEPFFGVPAPPRIEVTERGAHFVIRPYDGFSVGLFLDQRENRARVREMAEGKDVLNLFAYTCGFSVAAAVGGARSTVSVDISPKHLEWGRENFAANNVDLAAHQFIRSDAADYIKRAKRQKKRFDLIIIDPPSFAHGRKASRTFSIKADLAGLVAGAVDLLNRPAIMLISTNHRQLSIHGLRERLDEGAGRRRYQVIATPPLPVDFENDPQHAKTIVARFDG